MVVKVDGGMHGIITMKKQLLRSNSKVFFFDLDKGFKWSPFLMNQFYELYTNHMKNCMNIYCFQYEIYRFL